MSNSAGERELQRRSGSVERAARFAQRQVFDHLTPLMQAYIRRQEMMFMATADREGQCDCSPRFGPPGFVVVLDERTLAFPDYRGNGVFASLGNILENPHIGLVFLDFFESTVGLHVNGTARLYEPDELPESLLPYRGLGDVSRSGSASQSVVERWVVVTVQEAYIHCAKHVPRLEKLKKPIAWGTDDLRAKADGFFCQEDGSHPAPPDSANTKESRSV